MNSPKYGDRTAILKKNRPMWQSKDGHEQIDVDDSEVSSQAQILDRVKSDRVAVTQPEEDRRRRTIIVEKCKGTYGFTLQSYGIHYKKEQEIEMITYVDFVDYDGPAYRAGMREGDVILSINGHDMEKTDHKTLVNFIKNCDSRMRMVVLFEDCVRKVELHMRYIQVQRALRNKMMELERLCIKERELLDGKWKTHSLPARKKATSSTSAGERSFHQEARTGTEYNYCRPTVSTEDVASIQPHVVLAYQYMEPQYRAYLLQGGQSIASTVGSTNSADYLLSWNGQQTSLQQPHQHQIVVKSCLRGCRTANGMTAAPVPTEEQFTTNSHQHSAKAQPTSQKHRHLCAPCIRPNNQGDNGSLDAYDLASPCCDSRCVPTRRKSSHKQSSDSKEKGSKENRRGSGRSSHQHQQHQQQHYQQQPHHQNQQQPQQSHSHRYMSLGGASQTNGTISSVGSVHSHGPGSGLISQCSLHSCASNWSEHAATASNATSLSTDTLYWDDSMHSALTQNQLAQNANLETYATTYHIYNPVKPKSWDNLTTKGIGGYGFGYGYLENTSHRSGSQKGHSSKSYSTKIQPGTGCLGLEDSCGRQYYIVTGPLVSKSSAENLLCRTDSSHSCDCLDASSTSSNQRFLTAENPAKHGHHKQVHYEIHPLPQKQGNQHSQQIQDKQQQQKQQQQQQQQPQQPQQQQALRDMASQTDSKSAQGEVTRL